MQKHNSWWRVWVDGKPVSKAIYLPQSHGTWRGIATAESWTTNKNVACNAFGYRFDDIQIAQQATAPSAAASIGRSPKP